MNASLTLTTVAISTAQAGDGGIGGDGQPGGGGGQPGLAGGPTGACAGGQGGTGGRGGSGGGGLGGHSIGIAFLGSIPTEISATMTLGTPGIGGIGGNADATVLGAAGLGCKTLDFANEASCTK